ncbi:hypothetical protein GLOIN_2v1872628 [Rhizophagus clarus]|uniref:Uncharacterized protein n=1 Tax=Rhizophagus clarus TaxID=94130 RepID=A0A8H3L936_9GLOM|nr:hypothetical protein GLOIN_2v1872628 [Rhizophagus clarus]
MVQKNHGPCSVQNCNQVSRFRQFTSLAYEKAQKKGTYEAYTYLRIGQQLCHNHYMSIVEPDRRQKSEIHLFLEQDKENTIIQSKNYSFAEQVTMLTKVLYERRGNLELDPARFKQMIEEADPRLQGLFDKLVKALVPDNRSAYNKVEARKTIVSLCYIMAGLRNKFVNDFKLEVGLYLSASGATRAAIDTMNGIGFSACYTTVNNFKRKLVNEHPINIRKFFSKHSDHMYIYNLDDYHDIHEKRRPDTVTLSSAKHMATCICKQVSGCAPIPIVFNDVSAHNPVNIDASNICFRLIHEYHGIFDIAYTNRKKQWLTNEQLDINTFDQIELLTVHCYDDAIAERKEERSMKGVRLIGFQEKNLHSMNDYITALQMILDIDKDTGYLHNHVAPLVADWPGQLFVRKAITNLHKADSQYSIPAGINSFIPILGPLHVSLNSREHVLIVYYAFFQKLFHSVFGKRKVLAKKPKPWRINLLLDLAYNGWCKIRDTIITKFGNTCKDIEYRMVIDLLDNVIPATLDVYSILFRSGSFNEYLETIFRIWTFALRWKRHNYNKAPLAFLSDIFYWQDTNHPFAEAVKLFLVNFNDYYVENMHSKIRAHTPMNSNVDNIIKQAYVIDARYHCELEDTFHKTKTYPYKPSLLNVLAEKTSLFLLDYFQEIFKNRGKSKFCKSKKKNQCQLATLGETVDPKCLPTGYSTNMPPLPDSCDHCRKKLDDGEVLICGHGYHFECYQMMEYGCRHCEEYYKRGIYSNVNSFLDRLEKGPNVLTSDEQDEIPTEENESVEEVEVNENQEVHTKLLNALRRVNTW